MPNARKPPKYGLHKATGQARVVLNGQCHYLGPYGSDESLQAYERILQEWRSGSTRASLELNRTTDLKIVELIGAYLAHAESYYVKDGRSTGEHVNIRQALWFVNKLFGCSRVADFGPLDLQTVRQAMIDADYCRRYINDNVSRIKLMFKWAVSNEMAPPSIHHGLAAVSGLRRGRSSARESRPVRPVADDQVDAIRPYLSRQVEAMIDLQLLTGMRPGEIVQMKGKDLDRSSPLWEYRPESHKVEHHDKERVLPLGPRAQRLVKRFLKQDLNAYLFSPADAEEERREGLSASRKIPLSCGNRRGTNRQPHPKRKPKEHYTVSSYRRAIARACDLAFPPPEPLARREGESAAQLQARLSEEQKKELKAWQKAHRWHPNQLRHSSGTKIRKELGLEAAQVWLGHSKADVTQIYAERNLDLARQIAAKMG